MTLVPLGCSKRSSRGERFQAPAGTGGRPPAARDDLRAAFAVGVAQGQAAQAGGGRVGAEDEEFATVAWHEDPPSRFR